MIEKIIGFSIRQKLLVGIAVLALILGGIYSLIRLPIDAIPDITNNQVQIISLAPSLATQEVESFITAPIEVAVANVPDIIELRSISRLGLSVVTVVFKDDVDFYWARQQLSERLKEAEEVIPSGLAKIELAPISTGLGEIYQYRLKVEKGFEHKFTPMDLRTLQDWVVRREMLGTPGVADINSYGGFVKQYEIAVNPDRLRGMNLTLSDLFLALEQNNENTGSAYIDKKPSAYFIRGIGRVKNLEDIENIRVKSTMSRTPVRIRDVARVRLGSATRYGALVVDTTEAVGGVVMMLKGANAHEVIDNVNVRIASIQKSLPEGVTIEPFLNRSDLVGRAIGTVSRNLIEGALIIIFILVLMLGNLRAGLVVASVIPLSMLFAIVLMNLFGVSGNLMSLGAIDFGLIVDGAVIIVESVAFRLATYNTKTNSEGSFTQSEMDHHVFESARKMMSSATFGQIIILMVYLPIIALVGIEGKMFRPMGQVVIFALIGAALLSLTYVPMASALWLSKKRATQVGFAEQTLERIQAFFRPLFERAFKWKYLVLSFFGLLFLFSILLFNRLGGEFIPQLEEGDLAAGIITLQGGSLSNTIEVVEKANRILLDNFPEVKHVVCKIGSSEIPTDPTPMETGDYVITLKDKREWTSAADREELVAKMEEKLEVLAGVKFEFQQPIQMRFNELLSGSKQDIAIKLFGDDLQTLADKAAEIEKLIKSTEGVEDINVEKVTGLAQVQVEYNRDRLAEYGLNIEEVNRILRTAFAGSQAGVVFDEERRFGLVVRLDLDYRQSLEDVKSLTVPLPDGGQLPLEMIADIQLKSGPAQVSRENTKRRITVGFNVRNRDVESVIHEVSNLVDSRIKLPTGYYIQYGGQFENLEAARNRLAIAVPIALLIILLILYFTFHSIVQSLLIFTAVPMAAIGGVFALWLRDMSFSISAGVGFIALFGVAVLNGIVLIAEFNRLDKEGVSDIHDRVLQGLRIRLRPVLMTALVASLGFLPMAISQSAGAEVQRPLATVVIGGLLTATLLTLFILPILYILLCSHQSKRLSMQKAIKGAGVVILFMLSSFTMPQAKGESLKRLNLHQAIQMGLDNNLSVRASHAEVDVQKALKGASWDLPKTAIDGQYGQFNSVEKDNSFEVSQSFAFPTVYANQKKIAEAAIQSSDIQLKIAQIELAQRIKELYNQLVYLEAKIALLCYQDTLLGGFLKAADLKSRVGETNRLELVNARSQKLDSENQLQLAMADRKIYRRKLQALLNTDADILPVDTLFNRITYVPQMDTSRIAGNPSVAFVNQQVKLAYGEKQLARSRSLPDFHVGYFNQSMQGTQDVGGVPRPMGPGDRFIGIKAGIAIPLVWQPHAARAKAARIKEEEVRINAQYYTNLVRENYASLIEEYSKNLKSLDYYERQAVPEANLIIGQADKSYKVGAIDYQDYILNITRALIIKNHYLDAINQYNLTIIALQAITGELY